MIFENMNNNNNSKKSNIFTFSDFCISWVPTIIFYVLNLISCAGVLICISSNNNIYTLQLCISILTIVIGILYLFLKYKKYYILQIISSLLFSLTWLITYILSYIYKECPILSYKCQADLSMFFCFANTLFWSILCILSSVQQYNYNKRQIKQRERELNEIIIIQNDINNRLLLLSTNVDRIDDTLSNIRLKLANIGDIYNNSYTNLKVCNPDEEEIEISIEEKEEIEKEEKEIEKEVKDREKRNGIMISRLISLYK